MGWIVGGEDDVLGWDVGLVIGKSAEDIDMLVEKRLEDRYRRRNQ